MILHCESAGICLDGALVPDLAVGPLLSNWVISYSRTFGCEELFCLAFFPADPDLLEFSDFPPLFVFVDFKLGLTWLHSNSLLGEWWLWPKDCVVEDGETIDWRLLLRGNECCWICSVNGKLWKLSIGTVWAVAVDEVVLKDEFFELFKELFDKSGVLLDYSKKITAHGQKTGSAPRRTLSKHGEAC